MINYPEKAYKNLETIINEKITSLTNKLCNDYNDIKELFNQYALGNAPKEKDPLLSKSIKHLRLDSRSYNCLKKKQIRTIQKLVSYSEEDLRSIPYLGEKCINEIKNALKQVNLYLK